MLDKFKQGNAWHVRMPNGKALNLNTAEAAEMILDLWATIEDLEAQLRRRTRRKRSVSDGGQSE